MFSSAGEKKNRIVRGESMFPSLQNLDECLIVPLDPAQIKIGDILLYKTSGDENLKIHRVIRIDKKSRKVTLKGDNIPGLSDTVDLSCIIEKAIARTRNARTIYLSGPVASFLGVLTAFLSRYDMTPNLARRRALDPVAAALSANIFYALFRNKFFYNKITFASFENSGGMTVHAYAGGRVMASADLRRTGSDVLALVDIKWRDRNAHFVSLFLDKVSEISENKFGNFSRILVSPMNWPGMSSLCAKPVIGVHEVVFMKDSGACE